MFGSIFQMQTAEVFSNNIKIKNLSKNTFHRIACMKQIFEKENKKMNFQKSEQKNHQQNLLHFSIIGFQDSAKILHDVAKNQYYYCPF